jgi:aminoglycoside phosphotransferase (APT) family kinase protein
VPDPGPHALLASLTGEAGVDVAPLGEGWDNVVWAVGDDRVLRVRREPDPAAVERDVALLDFAAARATVTVPRVLAADPAHGLLLTTRVPGRPAAEAPWDPGHVADALAGLLTALHTAPEVPSVLAPDPDDAAAWLRAVGEEYAAAAHAVPADLRGAVEAFLAAVPPAPGPRLVPCHNDVRDDHVFVGGDGRVTGLIDWGDAVLGDPSLDLATVSTDFGDAVLARLVAAYDAPLAPGWEERVRFVARRRMVEDLAWRVRNGDQPGFARTEPALRRVLAD